MSKSRLEAFSDGFFAIIITIMVLDFRVPNDGTWSSIFNYHFVSTIISYIISFLLLTSFYVSHHQILKDLKNIDVSMLWINNIAIFPISLVPFVTSWHGEYPDMVPPAVAYGFVYALTLMGLYFLSHNVSKRISDPKIKQIAMAHNRPRIVLIFVTIIGTLLSFILVQTSSWVVALVSIGWFIRFYFPKFKL